MYCISFENLSCKCKSYAKQTKQCLKNVGPVSIFIMSFYFGEIKKKFYCGAVGLQ